MKTLVLVYGQGWVVLTILALTHTTIIQGAVLPGKPNESGDPHSFEEPHQIIHSPNSLWSPLDTNFALPRNASHQSIISISTILQHVLKKVQHSKTPEQASRLLEDMFEGVSNDDCKGHILEWMWRMGGVDEDINLFSDEEKWVLQMVDSWGKLPEGILSGHINALGDFDECIQIEVDDLELLNSEFLNISQKFEGRYCTAYFVDYNTSMMAAGRLSQALETTQFMTMSGSNPGMRKAVSLKELLELLFSQIGLTVFMPSVAICMPNSCSQSDIHAFFTNAFLNIYDSIPDVDPTNMIYPLVATCRVKEAPSLTAGDIVMISLLSFIVGISVCTGVLDYWHRHQKQNLNQDQGKIYKYFMAFSFYTNTKKWLSTRKSAEDLGCLHGIRFLSTCWVVLGHTYVVFVMLPQWNMIDLKNIYEAWTLMPVINGTFSVDTFFVMSGMLATYSILKMLDKTNGRFNIIMFYVHRYLRLTPTYAILVGIMATLAVYTGNGPSWNFMEVQVQFCRDYWWTNLLYINNLVHINEKCHGEAWYLANDFQFYILSPFIVYPLWKWPKTGVGLLILYTIASCISPALVVHFADAAPAALLNRPLTDSFLQIYQQPWARIQTFIVGIWLGWILYKTRGKRVNIPRIVVACLWVFSTILAIVVIYSIRDWFNPDFEIPEIPGYFYAALSRFSWALVVAWVIFACIKGYGGIVNTFLSWKVFMPLGRLTFSVYLTSFYLQMILQSRLNVPLKYDTYTMVNLYLAHITSSLLVGFLCTILFESPFIILQKLIFEGGETSKPQHQHKKNYAKNGECIKEPKKRYGIFYEKEDTIINTQTTNDETLNEKQAKD